MGYPTVQVLRPRVVPLGGLRALPVRRTLPHRDRPMVGAWCFVDHYGPVADSEGMDVAPHPHIGLQTVSWLFSGEVEHRDSAGVHTMVRPGELNLMTAGRGVAHSEVSVSAGSALHGVQLWIALPDADRFAQPSFDHFAAPVADLPNGAGTARVFLGDIAGVAASPVHTSTPLLGAEVVLRPLAGFESPVRPDFEYAVLLDTGGLSVNEHTLHPGDLAFVAAGADRVALRAGPEGARLLLLGGTPFDESIVMWWNFIGRTHDEIAEARADWEAGDVRFGHVEGYVPRAGESGVYRIPAPELPAVRLRPRGGKTGQ